MPGGDTQTVLNLIISGGGVLTLASLLRVQYEARITEQGALYREQIVALNGRITAQEAKIDALLKSNDQLADAALISAQTARMIASKEGG